MILAASAFLPWAYSFKALDGMTLVGYPSPLQYCGMVLGVLVAGLLILLTADQAARQDKGRLGAWCEVGGGRRPVFIAIIIVSIAVELGGLINVVYGGWLALLGAALAFAGTRVMLMDHHPHWPVRSSDRRSRSSSSPSRWAQPCLRQRSR